MKNQINIILQALKDEFGGVVVVDSTNSDSPIKTLALRSNDKESVNADVYRALKEVEDILKRDGIKVDVKVTIEVTATQ